MRRTDVARNCDFLVYFRCDDVRGMINGGCRSETNYMGTNHLILVGPLLI